MEKAIPLNSILNKQFVYRNAASTDVTITWRKFGWKPQSEKTQKK